MKKIWNDPVWSKVIAGLVLAILAWSASMAINYGAIPLFNASWTPIAVPVDARILIAIILFFIFVGITVIVVNAITKFDVFISAPMSFQNDDEYKSFRAYCMEIKELLATRCDFDKIYYAGTDILSLNDFSAQQHAATDDLKALRRSKRFLLIMPAKMNSSAIFEAGFAFRKGIPSIYFCKTVEDLPFLMRKINDSFRHVKIYEPNIDSLDELKKYIAKHGRRLFSGKKY